MSSLFFGYINKIELDRMKSMQKKGSNINLVYKNFKTVGKVVAFRAELSRSLKFEMSNFEILNLNQFYIFNILIKTN